MAVLLPQGGLPDAEKRLALLLCLREVGVCTPEQLWPFVAELGTMDYLSFRLILEELCQSGEAAGLVGALSGHLVLTPEGEGTLKMYEKRIRHTLREEIARQAVAYRQQLEERRRCQVGYEASRPGVSRIRLTIREGENLLLTLIAQMESGLLPGKKLSPFREKASQILSTLYRLPVSGNSGVELPGAEDGLTASPGSPVLVDQGGGVYTGWVFLQGEGVSLQIGLMLPDRQAATDWAISADGAGEELCGRLMALVQEAKA